MHSGYVSCRVPPETPKGPVFTPPATPLRPEFGAAYRSGALDDFFDLPAGNTEAALRVERPVARDQLADALAANAKRLGAPGAVLDNIERLRHPEARAVVTGQ